jgi:hypothetical protein
MVCDYYIDTSLVIEYLSANNQPCKIITDYSIKKRFISSKSDLNEQTCIDNKIIKNTYKKIIYENTNWIKDSYKKRYETRLKKEFPLIYKLIKVYKSCHAHKYIDLLNY